MIGFRQFLLRLATASLLLAMVGSNGAFAADDDEEDGPVFAPGLIGVYAASDGHTFSRRDEAVQFAWRGAPPDERLVQGEFSVHWRGRLFAIAPGDYRFYLHVAGGAAITIAGEQMLDVRSRGAQWFESSPVQLEYGYHPLEITFRKTSDAARIGLYWSGPKFDLEPLPPSALWHEPAEDPGGRFERGGELWRALRCANCHRDHAEPTRAGAQPAAMGPDLTHLAGNLSPRWLVEWLMRSGHRTAEPTASPVRMPSFGISQDEAKAIAAFLLSAEQADAAHASQAAAPPGNRQRGERLLLTLGCLACHQVGDLGSSGLFGGGDLTHIADKRPPGFFARWLEDPAAINADHRMPVFRLSAAERADLAAHLSTLGGNPANGVVEAPSPSSIQRGKQLVEQLRCGACHRLPPGTATSAVSIPLRADAPNSGGCLESHDRKTGQPGYGLSQADRDDLAEYLAQRRWPPATDGKFVLRERNCLACHARDAAPGISAKLPDLTEAHAELATLTPTLSPPSLTQVGDKLHDAALADAIALRGAPLRPWLAVRMPRFDLSPAELQALTEYFTTVDRISDLPAEFAEGNAFFRGAKGDIADVRGANGDIADNKSLVASGSRLVTSTGFGCTSCHQIGHSLPKGVSMAAHGPDLSRLGRRIRRAWFERWVHNPARIVPRIEMPAIQIAAPSVLGGRLDEQLAAVWHVLNLPGFEPPSAGPIRIARHRGGTEPAVLISDVVEFDGRVLVRPMIAGLANRHNVLFDFASNQLAGWWLGDTARQHTRGKGWYWEPAGKNRLPADAFPGGELMLFRSPEPVAPGLVPGGSDVDRKQRVQGSGFRVQENERAVEPVAIGGHARLELDRWQHVSDGVRLGCRVTFADDRQPITLLVEQELTTAERGGRQGFHRRLQIRGVPAGHTLSWRLTPPGTPLIALPGDAPLDSESPIVMAVASPGADVRYSADDGGCVLLASRSADEPIVCEAVYLTSGAAEPPPEDAASAALPAATLAVVPGYEAVRLPLPRDEMPTGLTWRQDGSLAFCSLKGGVWLARDTDGDGLEDRLARFADGLPAPYGIAARDDALDVCAKYGVVRLADDDADGRADRGEIVASGWGYTADYHDWAIGLPRDAGGNYYVALPCQQDDRSPEEAHLRGAALKLVPREPSPEQPRRYELQPLSAGLRFPMGLALDRGRDLFATDNQGNYTPFNELNHLVAGARYGFLNKLEAKAGLKPPFEEPAVNIPHPWTRSVNGICF